MHCLRNTDSERIQSSEEELNVIEQNWEKFAVWRKTAEISTLCRFLKKEGHTISIATDVTYKDIVGLRWPKLHNPDQTPFQVVTALALVKTADNYLVLIPRDSGDWKPSLECSGGFIRSKYLNDDKVSVDDFIKKRVCEDLHIDTKQINSCDFLTDYNAKEILEYMLIYEIILNQSKQELEVKHPSFIIVPSEYTPATHHLYTNQPLHAPSAKAMQQISN